MRSSGGGVRLTVCRRRLFRPLFPRVFKRSHSFTCTPRVHPLTEWTIPAFAFPAKAGTHLPTPKGWKAELALGGFGAFRVCVCHVNIQLKCDGMISHKPLVEISQNLHFWCIWRWGGQRRTEWIPDHYRISRSQWEKMRSSGGGVRLTVWRHRLFRPLFSSHIVSHKFSYCSIAYFSVLSLC